MWLGYRSGRQREIRSICQSNKEEKAMRSARYVECWLMFSDVHERKQVVNRDALHCTGKANLGQGGADSSFWLELWVAAM